MDKKCPFLLATEMELAEGFGDIILRYEQNRRITHRFIQIKHKQDGHRKITIGDLLTWRKSSEFSLVKYLVAYLKIKSREKFEGEIEDFVIATNVVFDFESLADKGISFTRMNTEDEFLNIGSSVRYKFDNIVFSKMNDKFPLWYYQPKVVSLYIYALKV